MNNANRFHLGSLLKNFQVVHRHLTAERFFDLTELQV